MSVTKEELDKIADSYHNDEEFPDKFIEDLCQFYTYDWVFSQIAVGNSILEMGYGEGNFTAELVSKNFRPTIIEGSELLVEKAKQLYPNQVQAVHVLFEEYEPTEKFDCVLATHVLEHVDDPVLLLKQMRTWIKPTGKIIIIVPNKESIHRQLAVIMGLQPALDTLGARDKIVGHQRVYSLTTLETDVHLAGLRVQSSTGFFLKTLPNSMMLEYSPELIKALNTISEQLPKNLLANIAVVAAL